MELRKEFEKQYGLNAVSLYERGMHYDPSYVEWLEQRLESRPNEPIVIGLLRELAVRANVVFPASEKELKWFDEGTENSGDFAKRLDEFLVVNILPNKTYNV